jgi:predicted membrane protein
MVVGLTIMLLGLTLLGDRLGMVQAWTILQYWPVMIILFGAAVIVRALSSPSTVPENPADRLFIAPPVVLLIVIIAIVATARTQDRSAGIVRTEGAEYVTMNAIMAGNRHTVRPGPFQGAQVSAVMGGINLDLRQATIEPGAEAVVDVFALMGGVDMFVPRDWNVEVRTTPIMGGVQDQRFRSARAERGRDSDSDENRPPAASKPATAEKPIDSPDGNTTGGAEPPAGPTSETKLDPTRPRLIVRGFIMMGGLQIRP